MVVMAMVMFVGGSAWAVPGYGTGTSSTTTATGTPPAAAYGSQPSVTATVSETGTKFAGRPTGKVRFVVTTGSDYGTEYANVAVSLATSGANTATYTFAANTSANATYRIVGSYSPTDFKV